MNLRNIDGTSEIHLKTSSHKHILFDCDICNNTVEQSYRNYLKQNDGKFCRKCRNKHTANLPNVKKKQSKATKERWNDIDYRSNITKKISEIRKKEWENGSRKVTNKTPYPKLLKLLLNENYILITSYNDYIKQGSNIIVMCPKLHHFTTTYTHWMQGHRCLECRKADFNKINTSFFNEKYTLLTKENEYINNIQKLEYLCPKGTKHSISWSNWQLGHRCPCCNNGMSKAEKEIADFIRQLNIDIELKNRLLISPLELDIIIPSMKIAIEYNGLYYHGIIKGNKDKNYHINKLQKCNDVGYRLITIFEDEWVTRKEIVKSRLKHILIKEKSIYARKCTVSKITTQLAKNFIDTHHIQGYTQCAIKIGAYYNNQLVAVMTFAKGNISKGSVFKENVWELSRFCTSQSIVGIAGKLLSYFEKEYKPMKIYSYADRRWSDGNVYKKVGFDFIGITAPNYWYFNDNKKRIHRFNFRKDKIKHLASKENMTEWDIMREQGYDKIYDCGNMKFEKSYD